MSLTSRERFDLVDSLVSAVEAAPDRWTVVRVNVMLQQFGLGSADPGLGGASLSGIVGERVGQVSDDDLVEIYSVILGVPADAARQLGTIHEDTGPWRDGFVRVFLSHSATEKVFVSEVAAELEIYGVQGFVAHESMDVDQHWQPQIELALRTSQAFVGIVHPAFNDSAWCQQEIGWAQGAGIPSYFVRLGADPRGFVAATQWPSYFAQDAKKVAAEIIRWLERKDIALDSIIDGLLAALREAGSYIDAGLTAQRLVALGGLSEESWRSLEAVYWQNDQLYTSGKVGRALSSFFHEHGRQFPPAKPEE